jgi:hypothetical protein
MNDSTYFQNGRVRTRQGQTLVAAFNAKFAGKEVDGIVQPARANNIVLEKISKMRREDASTVDIRKSFPVRKIPAGSANSREAQVQLDGTTKDGAATDVDEPSTTQHDSGIIEMPHRPASGSEIRPNGATPSLPISDDRALEIANVVENVARRLSRDREQPSKTYAGRQRPSSEKGHWVLYDAAEGVRRGSPEPLVTVGDPRRQSGEDLMDRRWDSVLREGFQGETSGFNLQWVTTEVPAERRSRGRRKKRKEEEGSTVDQEDE